MRPPRPRGLHHRRDDRVDVLNPAALEGQAAPWRPPRLEPVQPAGSRRQPYQLPRRPGPQRDLCRARHVGAQIGQAEATRPRGLCRPHQLQARHAAGAVPPWTAQGRGQPGGGLACPHRPHTAAAAVVRGAGGPARTVLPDLTGIRLGTDGAEVVEAEDLPCWAGCRPGRWPLVSTTAASTVTRHQRCWGVQTTPSAGSPCPRGAGVTGRPWRSGRACGQRASVQSAKGHLRRRDGVRARASTALRVVSSCWRRRPACGMSANPARPGR
jgi:hypothetical protein